MLKAIQQFFETRIGFAVATGEETASEHALQLATAALLIETSRADFKVEPSERHMVEDAIRNAFDLSPEETREIIRLAEEEADRSLSLYEFTHLVDRSLTPEQKQHVVELLWRVAFSDSEVEKHEEYTIRKIAHLIHVRHEDFIDAKLRARRSLKAEPGES